MTMYHDTPDAALMNALNLEDETTTRYFITQATHTERGWIHMSTSGSWDDIEVATRIRNNLAENRPESVFRIVCEVRTSQRAQAILTEIY